ncbi:MAG: hypothetical protein GF329_13780 [Candidatus Lokiarchaeota archaeon]|nr:hypothetical protein [Candidatus Lokiarchaeota archaeon]
MNKDLFLRIVFKLLIMIFIVPIILGAVSMSDFLETVLKKAFKTKSIDVVIRILSYQGLLGILELSR